MEIIYDNDNISWEVKDFGDISALKTELKMHKRDEKNFRVNAESTTNLLAVYDGEIRRNFLYVRPSKTERNILVVNRPKKQIYFYLNKEATSYAVKMWSGAEPYKGVIDLYIGDEENTCSFSIIPGEKEINEGGNYYANN